MNRYLVMQLGRNFLPTIAGKAGGYGFYTTRCVEADHSASAELKAVRRVQGDEGLKNSVLNDTDDPPAF